MSLPRQVDSEEEKLMKAYGHSRKDKEECRYGCCTTKSGKDRTCRSKVDRANRKSARQAALLVVCQERAQAAGGDLGE